MLYHELLQQGSFRSWRTLFEQQGGASVCLFHNNARPFIAEVIRVRKELGWDSRITGLFSYDEIKQDSHTDSHVSRKFSAVLKFEYRSG